MSKEASSSRKRSSQQVYVAAFGGIGAAIYYLLLWLPGVPVPGIPQITMEIGAIFTPLLGIILGPYIGATAVLIGNILKSLYPFNIVSLVFVPCAPLSAFTAAMLIRKRWVGTFIILAAILIAGMYTPPFYPLTGFDSKLGMAHWHVYLLAYYDKIAALVLLPIAVYMLGSPSVFRKRVGLFLVMFIGREMDKALGCLLFSLPMVYEGVFGLKDLSVVRGLYVVPALFSPAEYVVEALVAFLVAIPVIKSLLKVPGISESLYVKNVREQEIL
uniref:ECF transporter S component n=1 Tax=Ignisphaera aggregans TaxID=334771 RepID=A0A7C2VPF4_9CREN